jgi:hypothetical protein
LQEGGLRERMTRARLAERARSRSLPPGALRSNAGP